MKKLSDQHVQVIAVPILAFGVARGSSILSIVEAAVRAGYDIRQKEEQEEVNRSIYGQRTKDE